MRTASLWEVVDKLKHKTQRNVSFQSMKIIQSSCLTDLRTDWWVKRDKLCFPTKLFNMERSMMGLQSLHPSDWGENELWMTKSWESGGGKEKEYCTPPAEPWSLTRLHLCRPIQTNGATVNHPKETEKSKKIKRSKPQYPRKFKLGKFALSLEATLTTWVWERRVRHLM